MRYVLADNEKAILAGFDVITHNVIDIEGESKMVITEKGMMDTSLLVGDESEKIKSNSKALCSIAQESWKSI